MTYKTYLFLTCFLTAALSATSSYAVPNSYAEIIANEKQRMVDNNPQNRDQQSSSVTKAVPNVYGYGYIISKEKQRMTDSHPDAKHQNNSRMMKVDSHSPLPTTWGGLIQNEHARMKHSLP